MNTCWRLLQGRRSQAGGLVRTAARHTPMPSKTWNASSLPASSADARAQRLDDSAFMGAVRDDARKASGAHRLATNCSTIGSQLIDNLNASIHLRTLLTDLFLVDQAIRQATSASTTGLTVSAGLCTALRLEQISVNFCRPGN